MKWLAVPAVAYFAMIAAIVIHEVGHVLVLMIHGIDFNKIVVGEGPTMTYTKDLKQYHFGLLPVGGYTEMAQPFSTLSTSQKIQVTLGGPAMSITTGLIVAFAPKPASENFLSIIWAMTMIIFATLSILLGGIMQLLPHDGSDGALLLYALIQ